MEIHASALKHGISVEDIEHAVRNAIVIEELDDDARLFLGPSTDGSLLELIALAREPDRHDLVIHALPMRAKYQRLLPEG